MNRRREPSRQIDRPQPCYMRTKLIKGGPWVAALIGYRSLSGWFASINDERCGQSNLDFSAAANVLNLWTTGQIIEKEEYDYLLANKPTLPNEKIDHSTMRPPF